MMLPMILAQISDPHLRADGGLLRNHVDSMAAMKASVKHVNGLRPLPDVTVVTGDLVNEAGDYPALRKLLDQLETPCFVIPGNHDFPDALRAAFCDLGYLPEKGCLNYVIEDYPLRIVALDTSVPGEVWGAMSPKRLRWLNERLSEQPARPTVILMHHPPVDTGISYMDRQGLLEGAGAMAEIVSAHPQVQRILCGHVHRPATIGWAGTVVSTAPSVSFQMLLDLRQESQSGYVMEPAACALYYWSPKSGLAGHLSFIGDYGPPRAFKENSEET